MFSLFHDGYLYFLAPCALLGPRSRSLVLAPDLCLPVLAPNLYLPTLASNLYLRSLAYNFITSLGPEFAYTNLVSSGIRFVLPVRGLNW